MEESLRRKRDALFIVLCANAFLIGLKFFLAKVSGSMAIKASGWMSVENFFLTSAVLVSMLIAEKEERFARRVSLIENILAFCISIAIFYIAAKMFMKVVTGKVMMLRNVFYVTLGAIAGAGICYFMSRYKIYIGRRCASPSIEAAGYHCRTHVYMELAVIVGLTGYMIGLVTLNRLATVIVLIYVIYTGWTIFTRAYRGLTRELLPEEHALCHIERNYKQIAVFSLAILALYFSSGFYTVRWDEEGVVKRFGREIAQVKPGIHYHLPWPIETVQKVKVSRVREIETEPMLFVAGDENLIKVNLGVHYSIKDISKYLFDVAQPDELVKRNADQVIVSLISRDDIEHLLTVKKEVVEALAFGKLQSLMDRDKSGIQILSVQILSLDPPDEVVDAFRDVASAREDRETYIFEAEGYKNEIIPEALGKADAMVFDAQAYSISKVERSSGEANRYLMQLEQYKRHKDVTDLRLYLETMERILPGVRKVFVDGKIKRDTTDLWLINEKAGKIITLGEESR